MSVQSPPTNLTTPVYNPIFFIDPASSSGITIPFLDANYLKFPTAQGSEDFTNGLFSTDTIDFNSATGANRAITNLSNSSFSDILGNATYTASIEENSTAIGTYNGGLVITSSNSINLVGADILVNGVPVGSGGGDVFLAGNNTFTGTNTFENQVSIDNTFLSFPDSYIRMGNGTSILDFPNLIPSTSSSNSGLAIGWNQQGASNGEVDMVCYGQGGQGGFVFYAMTDTTTPTLITQLYPNGISFFKDIISDNTFTGTNEFQSPINLDNTTLNFQGNASIIMGNTTSVLDFPEPLPSIPNNNTGLGIGWNNTNPIFELGEVDFLCYGGDGDGGFAFFNMTSTTAPTQIATIYPTSSSFSSNPTIPTSTTIGTSTSSQTATTYLLNTTYAPLASPILTGTPTAPTATAGDNSTNIATTEFVSTATSSAISNTFKSFQWNYQPISAGENTSWQGYIPLSITMNVFYFLFSTNNPSTAVVINGGATINSNNTQFSGFGYAVKQNYTASGYTGYGYVFTILGYTGAPNSSPNLSITSLALTSASPNGCCYCKFQGLNDGGVYNLTPNSTNYMNFIITKWN